MTAATATPPLRKPLASPFPGLRPFQPGEEHIFFGRERQVHTMVDKLANSRTLAVVGSSGSGKSSLVNCGLRPALHRGLMAKAGSAWRIAQFRPGGNPIKAMAQALAGRGILFEETETAGIPVVDIAEATLRMSKLGIPDLYEQTHPDGGPNLLVVADQFEELFRFRQTTRSSEKAMTDPAQEAVAFVNLLLEARLSPFPIYVVLTMRSDFLGDCAEISGLAEAINEGQYLVPRLTREERRMAVTGPVAVGSGEISPVLVTQLINDVGDNPDQLSVLQHALNRTWTRWQHEGRGEGEIDTSHYTSIGGMSHALDQHADKAFNELAGERENKICERMFKALTDTGTDGRGVRRPVPLKDLAAICEATEAELVPVIDVFRKPSRSFLMPPIGERLTSDSVIDISHESLMRVWKRLKTWTDEEARSARVYCRLSETAALYQAKRARLAQDPELQVALNWRSENYPTAAWAERYGGAFNDTMTFLDASEAERAREWADAVRRQKNDIRKGRVLMASVAFGLLLAVAFGFYIVNQRQKEEVTRARAAATNAALVKATRDSEAARDAAVEQAARIQQQAMEAQALLAELQSRLSAATSGTEREKLQSQLRNTKAYLATLAPEVKSAPSAYSKIMRVVPLAPSDIDESGLFTVSAGLKVTSTSGATSVYNMFGATDRAKGALDVATFFADKKPANYRHWVEWQLPNPVQIAGTQLFAFHDSEKDIGYRFRRAFSRFKFYARIPGQKEWTQLVDFTPPLPYGQKLPGHEGDSLDMCFDVPPTTAREFRAEFVQAVDVLGQYSGPRVVKLDATSSACR
jgi:Novel STAND NTPase 1